MGKAKKLAVPRPDHEIPTGRRTAARFNPLRVLNGATMEEVGATNVDLTKSQDRFEKLDRTDAEILLRRYLV